MNIDKHWLLLFAIATSAVATAVIASRSDRRQRRAAHHREHKTALRSWENEGGNLAPPPAPALP